MSLLFGGSPERRFTLADLPDELSRYRNRGSVGVPVTSDTALRHGAVWSCVDLICRLAALPADQYRKVGDQRLAVASPSPLFADDARPDGTLHRILWERQILMSWLLRGNAFGAVASRDRLLYPTQIEIIHPDRMRARPRGRNGPIDWLVDNQSLGDNLIHWPAFTVPGSPIGLSPISYAATMIGLGLSAREFGAQWFIDGAHPSAILTTDKAVDADTAKTIKQRFVDAIRGTREPAVLGSGVQYHQIQINPNESQFLDTIKANKADVAGFFLVPPEMIGGESGSSMTYANLEQRGLSYLTFNAGWWVTLTEAFYSSLVPRGQYVKKNTGALVKVDARTQAQVQDTRIRGGWGTPNEARALEDNPPIADGDKTLWPPYSTSPQPPSQGGPANGA